MLLSKCKGCSYFIAISNNAAVCSYNGQMAERTISDSADDKIVLNCPLDESDKYEKGAALGDRVDCKICMGSGKINYNDMDLPCPLCQGEGNIKEIDSGIEEQQIPHIAEFRIQAVQVKDKYKVVMTCQKNNDLIAMSDFVEMDNTLFNDLFINCVNKLAKK